jgi:hypothetical protein
MTPDGYQGWTNGIVSCCILPKCLGYRSHRYPLAFMAFGRSLKHLLNLSL